MTDREIMEALLAGKRLLMRSQGFVIALDDGGLIRDVRGYSAPLSLGRDGDNNDLEAVE